jgi:Fur family zinc uptake transcriptional regulator
MDCHHPDHCKEEAIAQIEKLCAERRLRLTRTRKQILAFIWDSHNPVKAYTLLEQLKQIEPSAKAPIVYRALEFLEEHCFIHKLHTINMYVICQTPQSSNHCFFYICSECYMITEEHNMMYHALIEEPAKKMQFTVGGSALEIHGICNKCCK